MRDFVYALLAALLVSGVAFARTIVLPVQPVVVDANGAEVPSVHIYSADQTQGTVESGGYYWWVDLATGAALHPGTAYCRQVGSPGQLSPGSCPSTPTFSFATPMHGELR